MIIWLHVSPAPSPDAKLPQDWGQMEGIWLQHEGATWGIPKKSKSVPKKVFWGLCIIFTLFNQESTIWKLGLPRWLSGEESYRCRRCGFDPLVENISWRRKWQNTPVFVPGKSHGQRSLEGYSPCTLAKLLHSCPTPWKSMDRGLLDSSVHGILLVRILEWVAMPSSRGSSQPRDWTYIS